VVEVLDFLKEYWVIITFVVSEICAGIGIVVFTLKKFNKSMKCTLRNDILDIYDRCKDSKQISYYQLSSITYSYDRYKELGGNSFVAEIIEKVKKFELVD
jgi:hypothetical protein